MCAISHNSLQTQLGSPPVYPLRVVPDFVTSFHTNPLGNGMILLLFLGQESLDSESLVRRHGKKLGQKQAPKWQTKAEEGKRGGRTSLEGTLHFLFWR
jgi:hypothetical protein